MESINQIADLHALRVSQGLHARVPTGLWFLLYDLLILGMIAVGYQTAIADSRRSYVTRLLTLSKLTGLLNTEQRLCCDLWTGRVV